MIKYLFPFISGLMGAILFIVLYNNMYSQTIGVVRMDELVGSHIEIEGINIMAPEQIEDQAHRYGVALDTSIKEISEEYSVLLLVSPAVLSSGPDYTDIVKERIKLRLSHNE